MTYRDMTFCSSYKTCPHNCFRKLTEVELKKISEKGELVSFADFEGTEYCEGNKNDGN
ncbi:MAG: hypothetical protein NC124_02455 [Clostridium sp.]|nr:hypothetical protein [Clostridium sp.]